MADKTKIEWANASWSPVTGCTKVSEGCANCYAEAMAKRFWGERKFTDVYCHAGRLNQPLHWRKPRRIFVCSMSDLFHEKVPFEFVDKVFGIMCGANWHTFQILTKRAENLKLFFENRPSLWWAGRLKGKYKECKWPFRNVLLGVSVENQRTADERIPTLLQIPAAGRFVSFEPLLESIKNIPLTSCRKDDTGLDEFGQHIDWAIIGCESGPQRRPCEIGWVRNLANQCKAAGVPVFVKQLSINGKVSHNPEEWPEDLRIREWPKMD